jgi:hypothetical protein
MGCVPLIAVGGGVQVAGFGLALTQSVRTRREQSPNEASLARWTWVWMHRRGAQLGTWLRRIAERVLVPLQLMRPPSVSVPLSASLGLSGNLQGHLSTRRRGLPLDRRVDSLEDDVDDLRHKRTEERAQLEGRIDEVRSDIEGQRAELESERARQLGRSLRYEELGIGVFVAGSCSRPWEALCELPGVGALMAPDADVYAEVAPLTPNYPVPGPGAHVHAPRRP